MKPILVLLTACSLLFGAYSRDNTLETVYDDQTNLTWQDNAIVASQTLDWNASIDYCENLDFAGVQDWRLPNINELLSITDLSVSNPAIDTTAFQNTASNYYWSSTTFAPNTSYAWDVYFYYGNGFWDGKAVSGYVRCVRSGQIAPSPTAVSVPLFGLPGFAALALLFGLGGFGFLRRRG